jgi:hypothetical protein
MRSVSQSAFEEGVDMLGPKLERTRKLYEMCHSRRGHALLRRTLVSRRLGLAECSLLILSIMVC